MSDRISGHLENEEASTQGPPSMSERHSGDLDQEASAKESQGHTQGHPYHHHHHGHPYNPGQPPNQEGQPPNQGDNPPHQGNYPPHRGENPPNQGNYPPPRRSYPPNRGSYPPHGGENPPNRGSYPSNRAGYPPHPPPGARPHYDPPQQYFPVHHGPSPFSSHGGNAPVSRGHARGHHPEEHDVATGAVTAQPGVRQGEVPSRIITVKPNEWSTSLLDCMLDPNICFFDLFCHLCLGWRVSQDMGELPVLPCVVPGWQTVLRTKLRLTHGIQGSVFTDCLAAECLPMCSLCQLAREVKVRQQHGLLMPPPAPPPPAVQMNRM